MVGASRESAFCQADAPGVATLELVRKRGACAASMPTASLERDPQSLHVPSRQQRNALAGPSNVAASSNAPPPAHHQLEVLLVPAGGHDGPQRLGQAGGIGCSTEGGGEEWGPREPVRNAKNYSRPGPNRLARGPPPALNSSLTQPGPCPSKPRAGLTRVQVGGGLIQRQDAAVETERLRQRQPDDEARQHLARCGSVLLSATQRSAALRWRPSHNGRQLLP